MSKRLRFAAVGAIVVGAAIVFVLVHNVIHKDGNKANEERLRQIIRKTIKPEAVERKPLPADVEALLAWSQPVNGLTARIEYIWWKGVFFVRLKNVSDQPLTVPTGNPRDEKAVAWFEVYIQEGSSPWRRGKGGDRNDAHFFNEYFPSPPFQETDAQSKVPTRLPEPKPIGRSWVALQPGEDCVALFAGFDQTDNGGVEAAKVILRQTDTSIPGRWSGVLETPVRPMELSRDQCERLQMIVPFPAYFPPFSFSHLQPPWNMNESPICDLYEPNRPLIDMLEIYEPTGVCKEFARRTQAETIMPMKLLLASIAAIVGDEDAGIFLLEAMKSTDYVAVSDLHRALSVAFRIYGHGPLDWRKKAPPDWLVELSIAILLDDRFVTGLEKANFVKETAFTISSCGEALLLDLGEAKCRKVVPLLIDRLKKRQADYATLITLGRLGDDRAIPPLIEAFNAMSKGVRFEGDSDGSAFTRTAYVLGKLKAHEAIPAFLNNTEQPEIIETLGEIGDPSVLSALREIVEAKGRIVRDGMSVAPEKDGERLYAAKVSIARLDANNEAKLLGEMLDDPSITRHQRYDLVLRMGWRPNPQAIPYLVKVVKTDSDHYIICLAIDGLSEFKHRAAVEGLIECFDVTFKEDNLGKGERVTPATYRIRIAHSLQRITGQPFGGDKQQWLQWWREKGQYERTLK